MAEFKILYKSCVGYKASSVYLMLYFTRIVMHSVRTASFRQAHAEVQTTPLNNYLAQRLSSYLVCICNVTCMALGTIPAALPHLQNVR